MTYIDETKCPSCGEIKKFIEAAVLPKSFLDSSTGTAEYEKNLPSYECVRCGEPTAQDIGFKGLDKETIAPRRYLMVID